MTLKSRSFECPACQGVFTSLLEDTDPPPSECALCHSTFGDVIQLPSNFFIGSQKSKNTNSIYRAYEQQTIDNAKAVEAQTGMSANHMKMTNFTGSRQGDVVYKPAPMPQAHPQMPMPQNFTQGLGYAQMEKGRPGAGSGLSALESARSGHRQNWNAALNKGLLAKVK